MRRLKRREVNSSLLYKPCFWIGNSMRIPKMYLKLSFSYSKLFLEAILFLTVFSNCVSGSSNFDTVFSLTVPDFLEFFYVFG